MLVERKSKQTEPKLMSLPLNHLSYYALSDPVAANVGVMDKKDNYVSVVTSLNTWFGSKVIICLLHQKN